MALLALATIAQGAAAPAVIPATPPPVFDPAIPLEGVWLTAQKTEITITACPDDFCGNITKVVIPKDIYEKNKAAIDAMGGAGANFTDELNPDPTLRTRPIQGLQMLTLHPGDKSTIFNGKIYNPQDGKTYDGYVEVLGQDKIRLNGCILYNTVCKGEEWTRVPQPEPDAATPSTGGAAAPAAAPAAGSFQ
jgi:uncharacterized protein (DUF2147 family)